MKHYISNVKGPLFYISFKKVLSDQEFKKLKKYREIFVLTITWLKGIVGLAGVYLYS